MASTTAHAAFPSTAGPGVTDATVWPVLTVTPSARSATSERRPPGADHRCGPDVDDHVPSSPRAASVSVHGTASPRRCQSSTTATNSSSRAVK